MGYGSVYNSNDSRYHSRTKLLNEVVWALNVLTFAKTYVCFKSYNISIKLNIDIFSIKYVCFESSRLIFM